LDHNTWLKAARQEGLTEGEWIGAIHLCEQLLNRPETPTTNLAGLPLAELAKMAAELKQEVLKRR
jgi:hypothetical protein